MLHLKHSSLSGSEIYGWAVLFPLGFFELPRGYPRYLASFRLEPSICPLWSIIGEGKRV